MPRHVKGAAAQVGPNNEGTSREEIVERMLGLLEQAVAEDVEILAYPEMALTTYFPKRVRDDYDQFFETEMPPKALAPLLQRAREAGLAPPRASGGPGGRASPATWAVARRTRGAPSTPRSSPTRPAAWRGRSGRSTCRVPSSPTATPRSPSRISSSRATAAPAAPP